MPSPSHPLHAAPRTPSPSPTIEKNPANEPQEQHDNEKISITTETPNEISSSSITIRRAKLKDSQALGSILAAGFIEDDVFGEYLFPHRREHPDDYRLQFARMMRSYMYKRGHRVRVAVDSATSRVVGVASWERQGRRPSSKSTTDDESRNPVCMLFKRFSIQSLDAVARIIHPDRSVSVENKRVFDAEVSNYKHYWSGPRAETWYLSFLAVDPDYQGCGVGRALVQEGIRWGEIDEVCVSLISTECGDGFYRKLGFVDVGSATEGALKGLRGGNIKFYEEHMEKPGIEEENEASQS
ncbi:hypothetical protein FG00117.1 [Paecilomyces variotii No. 5]|uniref:N-acetyltransferase domain-containing protein n=1 Tax=Byssochlamys spectabilis (strain No. 5 / NBRC 109023) TaxID=1356009 RepID=V5G7P0_BYSSN|nr:hypothetical protein FG00117.1 [Paecilomyces variotii No. 5]